jgi:hypothetical protein
MLISGRRAAAGVVVTHAPAVEEVERTDDAGRTAGMEPTAGIEPAARIERAAIVERPDASVPGDTPGVTEVEQVDAGSDVAGTTGARRIRRLAFEAPSGTRIYWTFDSGFPGGRVPVEDRTGR